MAGRDSNTARKGRSLGPASRQLDWAATLAAKGPGALQPQHLHFRRQPQGRKTLHLVLLDQSASMLRGQKLAWAKGCVLALSTLFYRRRDAMAVLGFAGEQAQWLQKPGKAGLFNEHWIAPLRGGGATPIQSAIDAVQDTVRRAPAGTQVAVWLLTDGRFDPLPQRPRGVDDCYIIDFEDGAVALGRCHRLAEMWGGTCVPAAQWGAPTAG